MEPTPWDRIGMEIKSDNVFAYRPGQWALIVGITELLSGRLVYQLIWPDGATDTWPIEDPIADYHFRGEPDVLAVA